MPPSDAPSHHPRTWRRSSGRRGGARACWRSRCRPAAGGRRHCQDQRASDKASRSCRRRKRSDTPTYAAAGADEILTPRPLSRARGGATSVLPHSAPPPRARRSQETPQRRHGATPTQAPSPRSGRPYLAQALAESGAAGAAGEEGDRGEAGGGDEGAVDAHAAAATAAHRRRASAGAMAVEPEVGGGKRNPRGDRGA